MAKQRVYGVYFGDGKWGVTLNKAFATKKAKEKRGVIYSNQYDLEDRFYDSVTFRRVGTLVADYRDSKD